MEELSRRERRKLQREQDKIQEKTKDQSQNLFKYFVILLVIAFVAFIGFKIYRWAVTPAPAVTGEAVEVKEGDWIKGNKDAQVSIIEYSDFQCPACKSFSPLVNRISEEYKDNIKVIYRHFPLPQHKNSRFAAFAAEAAGKQGKFWEMHDVLFDKQEEWAKDSDIRARFEMYAQQIGLNKEQFITDYESQEVKDAVNADVVLANSIAVNSTPTFLVNGKKVTIRGYEDLKGKIDSVLISN